MLSQWQHLLRPIDCGPMHLKNRLTAAPINTGLENLSSLVLLSGFWARVAADGVSLITVVSPALSRQSKQGPNVVAAASDDFRRYRKVLEAASAFGCRTALQLNHVGQDAVSRYPVSSVSGVSKYTGRTFHAAPAFLIRKAISQFIACAQEAASVGFDAVEINASGRSFIASFLSPAVNTRRDAWGTNQLGRFRFLLEVVRGCKKAMGEDQALGVRFNLVELSPKGASWDEILRLIQMLRIAGADYLIGVAGGFEDRIPTHSHAIPDGVWLPAYEALAQASDLPVFFQDASEDFKLLEDISSRLENAVFSFSSPLVGDNAFIRKKLGLDYAPVDPWINHHDVGVPSDILRTKRLFSLTDPCLFGQYTFSRHKTQSPKRVAVIGGGLAGMLFALVASNRGHAVTLFEKGDELGGQLHFLNKIENFDNHANLLKIIENRLNLSEVNVVYNKRVQLQELKQENLFDVYIVATGSEPEMPDIPGINASNVVTYEELLTDTPVGNRVAIIGNGRIALGISRYLLENKQENERTAQSWRDAWGIGDIRQHAGGVLGFIPEIEPALRQLYLIELDPEVTKKLLRKTHNQWDLTWLLMRGAQTVRNVNIELIDNYAVRISDRPGRTNRHAIRVDHVVVCAECTPNLLDRVGYTPADEQVLLIGAASSDRGYMGLADIVRQVYEKAALL